MLQAHRAGVLTALAGAISICGTLTAVVATPTIAWAQAIPVIASVENAEGGRAAIAPNMWMEIDGTNLAPAADRIVAQFPNNQMPRLVDGVGVTVNGKAAYMFYVSPTQLNVLTPPDAMTGSVQVQVSNGGIVSASVSVPAQAESPSFFGFNGGPYVAALHTDQSIVGAPSLYPGLATPARAAEVVRLFANGFGPTSTPVVPGSAVQEEACRPCRW